MNIGERELPGAHATAVFRILQESLSNVARHSGASRVTVTNERNGSDVSFNIRENGAGFSTGGPRKPNPYGLRGLCERASPLDGEASITRAPGEGPCVRIRLPVTLAAAS